MHFLLQFNLEFILMATKLYSFSHFFFFSISVGVYYSLGAGKSIARYWQIKIEMIVGRLLYVYVVYLA